MDRAVLETLLGEGLSPAEIGRRVERHESTVSYWLDRFDLKPVNAGRNAPRGGLTRAQLEPLVEEGLTLAEIAERLARSKTTVRHWLQRYGLKTQSTRGRRRSPEAIAAMRAGLTVARLVCSRHGETPYVLDGRGYYRCRRCRAEAVASACFCALIAMLKSRTASRSSQSLSWTEVQAIRGSSIGRVFGC